MKHLIYFLFIALAGIASCSGPELEELDFFEVSTSQPQSDPDLGRVQLRGVLNGSSVEDHGFIWSTSLEELVENPEGARRQSLGVKSDNGEFNWITPPLSLDSLYYFKAYASSGERMMYGQSTAFLWGVNVGINEVSRKNDTLNLSGFISGLEGRRAQVSDYGIVYSSIHQEPLITQDDTVSLGARNFDGAFDAKVGALEFNTTYYLRFYMKTQLGIYYDTIVTYRVTDGWKRLGFINQPLTRATVAYTADKAYLGWGCTAKTGNCPAGNANPGFQLIQDPLGIWESLPAIPDIISGNNARVGAKAFIINDKLYVGSGTYYDNSINQYALDLIQYTPQTNQWTEIPDGFPPHERVDAVAFTIGGKAYYGLGDFNDSIMYADFHEFDPARPTFQKWEAMASLNTALTQSTGFSIANKGYVVGGLAPGLETTRRCWEFSPPDASNPGGLWTELPPMEGVPRYGAVAFVIGNKAYVGLGENPYGELADFWEFDPSKPNDPWRQVTSFPGKPRGRAAAFAINGLGYIVGGDGRNLGNNAFVPRTDSDVWVYYPETN